MSLRNKVSLIGNVGSDVEIVSLESGKKIAKFSLATNETYKNSQGEKVTDTEWHKLVVFGPQAEIAEKYITKGKEIAIEGRIKSSSYDDKNNTEIKRYSYDIIVSEFVLLGSKPSE